MKKYRILDVDGVTLKLCDIDEMVDFVMSTPFVDLYNYTIYNEEDKVLTNAMDMGVLWVGIN